MEKSVSQRIKLGIMVLLGMTLFTLGIYLIGNKQNMFGRVFEISCDFKDVSGLKLGNNVRYLGIEVGNVVGITMLNDTAIRVTMVLDVKAKGYMKKKCHCNHWVTWISW